MTHKEQPLDALVGVLAAIVRRLEAPGMNTADREQIERDLAAVDTQLAAREQRVNAGGCTAPMACPITGEPMQSFRLLSADVAVSDAGLWFGPGHLQSLLATYRISTEPHADQPTSLEQLVLEIEQQERRAHTLAGLRRLRRQVEQARARLSSPGESHPADVEMAGVAREIERIKSQIIKSGEPVMAATPPNITPRAGALVSLVREGEKPCYLFAHTGSKAWMGRSTQCQIRVDDPRVSRMHCVIVAAGPNWYLADLDSRNGTWVNGRRIAGPTRLAHSDTICLGGAATMVFSIISIAVNEQSFYNLAFRQLTGQATVEDREELRDLITGKGELRSEFDLLQHGAVVAREALPLMEALGATTGTLPAAAQSRLDAKVKATFRVSRGEVARAAQSGLGGESKSPRSAGALTALRVGSGIELRVDLHPGSHRGGVWVRKEDLARLLNERHPEELLAQALGGA